jgi:hypothetical protein
MEKLTNTHDIPDLWQRVKVLLLVDLRECSLVGMGIAYG